MKKHYLIIPMLGLLISCGDRMQPIKNGIKEQAENIGLSEEEKKEENPLTPQNLRLSYSSPVENRQSDFMIIRLRTEYITTPKDGDEELCTNFLFFNPNTGQMNYMDTSYVGFIYSYEILTSQKPQVDADGDVIDDQYNYYGKNTSDHLILLRVANSRVKSTRTTTNKYGKSTTYDESDGYNSYLAVVKDDGTGFTPITPVNSDIIWWSFIQQGKAIMASVVLDSDNNNKIEDKDKKELFYIDLSSPTMGETAMPTPTKELMINDFIKRKSAFDKK